MLATTESFANSTNTTIYKNTIKHSPLPSAITFTSGVVGNIIAIFVLIRSSKRHKWNVFYRFVMALAITDLFGILTTSPVAFAVYDNNSKWIGGEPLCHYMSFMLIFAGLSTVLLVGAMAMDRYLAILHPFRYNNAARYTIVNIVLICIWLFSALVSALPLLGFGENVKQFPQTWCFFNFFGERTEDEIYAYFYSSLGLAVILMTAVLNICVIKGLMSGKRSQMRRGSVTSAKAKARTDVYITVFLVAIFVVFAVCWAPFLIRIIINQSRLLPRNIKADLLTLRLATLNQILDPWVYILFRRETLAKVTQCMLKQKKGTIFRRLASITGTYRTPSTETSVHGTNGTPVPKRRHIVTFVNKSPKDVSITECEIQVLNNDTDMEKDEHDESSTAYNNM